MIVRWPEPLRETVELMPWYLDELLNAVGTANERRRWRLFVEVVPAPRFVPTYQAKLVDAVGNIWIERFRTPDDTVQKWIVFDGGGTVNT